MAEIAFDQGWTLQISVQADEHISLDWHRTGSVDPDLSDLLPWEARDLAGLLLDAADQAERGDPLCLLMASLCGVAPDTGRLTTPLT